VGPVSTLAEQVEVPYPQQPHCATQLLLDTSGSMAGAKMEGLRAGLQLFLRETSADELASKRVDLSILTFGGGVRVAHDFAPVTAYPGDVPLPPAQGDTPMGNALRQGMERLEARKAAYRAQGTDYYRPWLMLITDGQPTDMHPGDRLWQEVAAALREGAQARRFAFFAVGVEGADMDQLRRLCPPDRPPLLLRGLSFVELFSWLSRSQRQVSASRAGDAVALPPVDWGTV
jgi:uncharacterized protein YegL